ncbi:hypothetical protein [Allorhizocola rhizosphaerae]|uniref:hypothetical protein n=1 Tax=Allorhizocola rhizosphaerae TaxID=1872709 RepID=UPI0013C32EC6|nr:hypothetical protein [Allorhizocola rhizosphaerae]
MAEGDPAAVQRWCRCRPQPRSQACPQPLLALDLAAARGKLSYVDELVVRRLPGPRHGTRAAREVQQARNALLTAWALLKCVPE